MIYKEAAAQIFEQMQGKSEADARKVAEDKGWIMRVTERNGQYMIGTCDLRGNRINVVVTDDVVTECSGVG